MVAGAVGAGKAVSEASKALLGDIYTRRWVSQTGAGRKKHTVEHELKINSVSVLAGGAVLGGALLTGAVALWMTQQKVQPISGKDIEVRLIRRGEEARVVHHAEVSHVVLVETVPAGGYYKTVVRYDSHGNKFIDDEYVSTPAQYTATTVIDSAAYDEQIGSTLRWIAQYGAHIEQGAVDELPTTVARRLMDKVKPYDWVRMNADIGIAMTAKSPLKIRYHSAIAKSYGIAERKGFTGFGINLPGV